MLLVNSVVYFFSHYYFIWYKLLKGQSLEVALKICDTCKHIKLPNYLIFIDVGKKQP